MDERQGDWCQTFTGRQFWPMDPRPEDVCLEDIAHALSLQCRFAGHCREFYSVAEHSVRVSRAVESVLPDEMAPEPRRLMLLAALLHDASEAYLVDVPRPVKPYLVGYREAESRVMVAVESWAGLYGSYTHDHEAVKCADEALLRTEARATFSGRRPRRGDFVRARPRSRSPA